MERANVNLSCANGETLIVQVFGGYRLDIVLSEFFLGRGGTIK